MPRATRCLEMLMRAHLPGNDSIFLEAWRIRYHLDLPSFYRNRFQRMREMLAFIQYGRQRGSEGGRLFPI